MPPTTQASIQRGMARNNTGTTRSNTTTSMPEATPTLSEREQLKIEFYKTYDVMTGVRIAATLGGFFSLMVLLVIYKSRCKSNRQLEDPTLKAAAAAAVEEAEAEERALAAALEEIARQRPRPGRGPRRSLCVDVVQQRLPLVTPRFASVGGDYDSLLAAVPIRARFAANRRCSSITCSSTASSYLERRGSAMVMPCLPPPPTFPRHATAFDEPWDYYHHPIDIQVIQPTPEMSPCGSEAGLYGATSGAAAALRHQQEQQHRIEEYQYHQICRTLASGRRAPLASMGSMDPPDPDSRSLGSDSVFLEEAARRAAALATVEDYPPDTEDEVSGFSTDSSDGPIPSSCSTAGSGLKRFLKVPPKKKRPPERWDGCSGCVPRRRLTAAAASTSTAAPKPCMTISASVEAPRSPMLSTTTSSSASNLGSPPQQPLAKLGSTIELKHRPKTTAAGAPTSSSTTLVPPRSSSSPPPTQPLWSQETLF